MLDSEERPLLPDAMPFEEAQERLAASGLADGLPLVPPTERRLAAMMAGVREPGTSRGLMPPMFGELLPEDVAYQCVLAGCRPGVVPLVMTAAAACLEPELNLLGVATTTGSAALAMIVHGPIAVSLGLNASINCLGPGNRANATIGRALALVLRNIGGAREETGDMATVGQPGKYTFCFAEAADPVLPTIAERRGLGRNASAVTVMAVSGTDEVLPDDDRDTPQSILGPMATIMRASMATNGAARKSELPHQMFILPPELAGQIVGKGWDLARICLHLYEEGVAPSPAAIDPIVTGGPGVKMAYLPMWGGGSKPVTRVVGAS